MYVYNPFVLILLYRIVSYRLAEFSSNGIWCLSLIKRRVARVWFMICRFHSHSAMYFPFRFTIFVLLLFGVSCTLCAHKITTHIYTTIYCGYLLYNRTRSFTCSFIRSLVRSFTRPHVHMVCILSKSCNNVTALSRFASGLRSYDSIQIKFCHHRSGYVQWSLWIICTSLSHQLVLFCFPAQTLCFFQTL